MNYLDIKQILDRKAALNKKGTLLDQEIKSHVKEWHDTRTEAKLNEVTVRMEMKALKSKVRKYSVPQLGEILEERDDDNMRILVRQMGGCTSKEIKEIKIAVVEKMIRQYDMNVLAFLKLNFNLVQCKFISKPGLLAPQRRKRNAQHRRPQHPRTV